MPSHLLPATLRLNSLLAQITDPMGVINALHVVSGAASTCWAGAGYRPGATIGTATSKAKTSFAMPACRTRSRPNSIRSRAGTGQARRRGGLDATKALSPSPKPCARKTLRAAIAGFSTYASDTACATAADHRFLMMQDKLPMRLPDRPSHPISCVAHAEMTTCPRRSL